MIDDVIFTNTARTVRRLLMSIVFYQSFSVFIGNVFKRRTVRAICKNNVADHGDRGSHKYGRAGIGTVTVTYCCARAGHPFVG